MKEFDYRHMSKSPAVFDTVKLKWMNGEYLKAMDFEEFYELAEPYIRKVITKDFDLKKIAALVKTRIEIFPDIAEQIDFFEELPEYDTALYTHKKMKTDAQKRPGASSGSASRSGGPGGLQQRCPFRDAESVCGREGVQDRICDVAYPDCGVRKTEYTGRSNRDYGSASERGVSETDPQRNPEADRTAGVTQERNV